MPPRAGSTIPIDEIVQLIARTVGTDKSKEVVSGAANLVGVSATDLTQDQARRVLDTLATIPGLVGAAARFARKRLGLSESLEASVGTSNPPSSTPAPSVAPAGRRGAASTSITEGGYRAPNNPVSRPGHDRESAGRAPAHDSGFAAKPSSTRDEGSGGRSARASESPPENRRTSTAKSADLRRTTGSDLGPDRRGSGPDSGKEARGSGQEGGRDPRRITGAFEAGLGSEPELPRRGLGGGSSEAREARRTGGLRAPDEDDDPPESVRGPALHARSSATLAAVTPQARLPRADLVALLAHSLGREKGDELVTAAAKRLNLDASAFNRDEALRILGDLAGTPGIVGVTAKFAKARAVLRFPN